MTKRGRISIMGIVLALFAGCTVTTPTVQERMIIAPTTIVFSHSIDSTVSITHSCTCPFYWWSSIQPVAPWLIFPDSGAGDKNDVPISIDSSKLTLGTNQATIRIMSNSYGTDTIQVTAIK